MLPLLGAVLLLSTFPASGSLAQESEGESGLYENVFGKPGAAPIRTTELPLPVRLTMRTAVRDLKVTEVGVEIAENGELVYVVDFENPATASRGSMDVNSVGNLLQLEQVLTAEQLPPLIATRMDTWMPNLNVTQVEKSVRPDAIVYEVDGTDAEGNEIYVEIPAHGRSVTMQIVSTK
jgi:hypothetical protein